MHNYLRAIGFSNLQNEKDIKEILTEVFHDFDEREVSREGKNKAFVEYTKSFGENMGIKMCGIMDTDGFHQEYYFPYFQGKDISSKEDLIIDKDHLIVISPDEGALDRAVYFANVLGVDTGMFYKRRDYSKIVNGKNPIVAHEFLGDNIDGKDVIIMDDMISSGGSMIDTARQLKEMNANRVFICATFGLFTDGLAKFDEAYEKCYFDKIVTTNLTYQLPELKERPYYVEADMSKLIASIVDFMNHDSSMSNVYTSTEKIHQILDAYNRREDLSQHHL